jgi:hypothetical protein
MRSLLIAAAVAVLSIGSACRKQTPTATAPPPAAKRTFTSKSGATYAIVTVPENDSKFERFEPPAVALGAPSPDNFHGTDRAAAKTSISTGPSKTFGDVGALLDSGLFVADSKMLKHKPPIPKDKTSDRVAEEQHNVVVTGFLYASTHESDNDFHCIVGMPPGQPQRFVNVELSGLPVSGPARAQLRTARTAFKDFFGDNLPAGSGYTKFDPPIKVKITGSIFFDVDHKAGVVGPQGMRPKTAWEIHPVTDIEFEPQQ